VLALNSLPIVLALPFFHLVDVPAFELELGLREVGPRLGLDLVVLLEDDLHLMPQCT
jgi:hypothetical protein